MLIYEKMAQIMKEIPAIGKNSRNSQQGFNFRGIDDLMNAMYPVLVQNEVFVMPEVLETHYEDFTTAKGSLMHRVIAKVKYTFTATDGSSVSAISIGEGMDSGDKASPKAMAIAMKYAIFQSLCIPTEEMKNSDPDFYTPEAQYPKNTIFCEQCGEAINGIKVGDRVMSSEEVAQKSFDKYGKHLCMSCSKEAKKAAENA